jgi:hypothetical protein
VAAIEACSSRSNSSRHAAHCRAGSPGFHGLRDQHRILVAAQRPEVVPVRIGRLVGIALVADRRRHQAEQVGAAGSRLAALRSLWRRPSIQASTRCTRGQWRQEGGVTGVAPDLGHGVEVLAVAVVFHHRVGAARVHTAGHLARSEDVAGEPVGELARGLGLAQAQQAGDHHRAVAHPAARVGACAGLQRRALARHQHVGQRTAQRVDDGLRIGRHRSATRFRRSRQAVAAASKRACSAA